MAEGWQPLASVATARRRAALLQRMRDYFAAQGVLAVDTPALGSFAVTDRHIESLPVTSADSSCRYLQTSPEFFMKRMLAAGYPDIYTVARVFRDGECGRRHVPEFTMLEWYRLGFGLGDMIADTVGLLAECMERPQLASDATIVDYADAFRDAADVDVFTDDCDDLARRAGADAALRAQLGDDRQAWLDLILTRRVAPAFAKDRLTVLRHYPAEQAALARICPADGRVADRFEVFHGDLELANGYVELADAAEQRQRFEADRRARARSGKAVHAIDPRLLDALAAGLPDCAGVALGLERLHMVYDERDDIRELLSFTPETGNE